MLQNTKNLVSMVICNNLEVASAKREGKTIISQKHAKAKAIALG